MTILGTAFCTVGAIWYGWANAAWESERMDGDTYALMTLGSGIVFVGGLIILLRHP